MLAKVGFIYTFWVFLFFKFGLLLEQRLYFDYHSQMASSKGFLDYFSITSKLVCCDFSMKRNVAFISISFAVLEWGDQFSCHLRQIPAQLFLEVEAK